MHLAASLCLSADINNTKKLALSEKASNNKHIGSMHGIGIIQMNLITSMLRGEVVGA